MIGSRVLKISNIDNLAEKSIISEESKQHKTHKKPWTQ
jgi:hypothetical protein